MTDINDLQALINERLAAGEVNLPVFDDIALRIHKEVRENKLDADLICQILEEDLALVAELLRMANSSFFSGMSPVGSLREAAVRLGVRQIASIVFSVSQKRLYSASNGLFSTRLKELWKHTSAVSITARWLAANAGYRNLADEVFVGGLLHDIGKLSLLCIMEELISAESLSVEDGTIDQVLLQMHCEHGAGLVDSWNLPENFREIILNQGKETVDESDLPLCIIRFVDVFCNSNGLSDMACTTVTDVDFLSLPEAQALSLTDVDIEDMQVLVDEIRGGEQKAAA